MKWPKLTAKRLLAVAMSLFLVLSLAAIQGAVFAPTTPLDDPTADVNDTIVAGNDTGVNPTDLAASNVTRQRSRPVTNCTNLSDRQLAAGSHLPLTTNNTSRASLPARHVPRSLVANGTSPAVRTKPVNATSPTNTSRHTVPPSLRETCRLLELHSLPEWVTEMAANRTAADRGLNTNEASQSVDAYSNTSEIAAAQLTLARDLRDIFTDASRSRREATFAAAELALAERKTLLADLHVNWSELPQPVANRLKQRNVTAGKQFDVSASPQLAAQQTKLQGAHALLATTDFDSNDPATSGDSLTRLTETGFSVQAARLQTETRATDPSDVTLPAISPPDHDTPAVATKAILEAHDADLTDEQVKELNELESLPAATQRELTDVLNAYLAYYRTVRAPNGTNVQRVRAAQLRLLRAAVALEAAAIDSDASENAVSASQEHERLTVQIAGVVSIDLSRTDTTYSEDYQFQLDAGGDDVYNNNAGGANASGNGTDVAALIDFGGHDTYNGRNGGGRYIVSEAGPSPPPKAKRLFRPRKGEAAGFLFDAGTGNDTYTAEAHGSNGGGKRGAGFLVDAGGADIYNGSGQATNGAGYKKGTGFLLDGGVGDDTYVALDKGVSNGAGGGGRGFLFDVGGNDTYRGSNGGSHLPVEHLLGLPIRCTTDPRERNLRDNACRIFFFFAPYPRPPESGGFLVDGGGSDTYNGSNGGGNRRGSGFLLDAGTGDDTYEGKNGAGNNRAAGFLLDMGGHDSYVSDRSNTRNGAGQLIGVGFLMDGGSGDDTYDATTGGAPGARQRSHLGPGSLGANGGGWMGGHGFLVDGGGNDSYLAGSVGTNGGATSGDGDHPPRLPGLKNPPTGFLLDASGDDRYKAGHSGVNGGGYGGVGLLYDNAGTDHFTERSSRCIDCSNVPKGAIGAQVDRGGGTDNGNRSTGSSDVLVVDDATASGDTDCPDASYEAIQAAVDAAEPGDTVRVCAGTYPGNVTVETRNVRVEAGPGRVVLDGANERRVGVALVARQTAVTGFTATNFRNGFVAVGGATTVRQTTSINNTRGILVAGLYSGGALPTLPETAPGSEEKQPTVIANNQVTGGKLGITVTGTGNVRVAGNTIRAIRYGISLLRARSIGLHNNTVSGDEVPVSSHQGGITSVFSGDITMVGNTVTDFTVLDQQGNSGFPYGYGGYGIRINTRGGGERASHTLRNNAMADNTFNLVLDSVPDSDYRHFTIPPSNTVNNKPVVYLVGATGVTIGPAGIRNPAPASAGAPATTVTTSQALERGTTPGYLACIRCTNVTIRNLDLSHNGHGVLIVKSQGIQVTNVTVHDTLRGIGVRDSPTDTALTNNRILDTKIAIRVVHSCDPRRGGFRRTYRRITSGRFELCANPSVLVAHNTIRRASRGGRAGGAIMVHGPGVTVRNNDISNVSGAGIAARGGSSLTPGTGAGAGILGTGKELSARPLSQTTVRDNAISDASIGISMLGTRGTTVAENTIRNAKIGMYTAHNNRVTYRANLVTNATTGMFVHWTEVSITARNNTFREVKWGLDGRFLYAARPPHAPATHDFGITNTVNGERILWVTGAVHRTIDAADVNMVVCIRCVDVTIRDMTLTDNSHGIMLWDSTSTLVTNVRITDTFRTGVLIRAGANNTVQNSTITDSTFPIFTWPIVRESSPALRAAGSVRRQSRNIRENTSRASRETVGPVRIMNNRITVDDASWSQHLPGLWTDPDFWGHYGILLFDTNEVTITDNNVTKNRWGITAWGFRSQLSDIRIVNNSITSPRTEQGFARHGSFLYIWERTIGMRVAGRTSDSANSSLTVRNNTLTAGPDGNGVVLGAHGPYPSTTAVNNRVQGYKHGLIVRKPSNATSASIRRNRFVGAKAASVLVVGPPAGETVDIHQNLLDPLRFGYGVKYKKGGGGGGHMSGGSGGGDTAHGMQPVDARCNRWAAPNGPSSQRMTLVDPVTGEPADGNGSAVSRGHKHGQSNVHFHPWLGNSPGRTCAKELVGTATPTPTPGPTRTPWPTAEPGPGDGTGPGDGNGTGSGDGNGTGPGPGPRTATGGGEGTSTATARVPATATPTDTPPQTATPEIVPGFGMAVWLVAFALLVAVLAARRRD